MVAACPLSLGDESYAVDLLEFGPTLEFVWGAIGRYPRPLPRVLDREAKLPAPNTAPRPPVRSLWTWS
jgi:hypothetical protein